MTEEELKKIEKLSRKLEDVCTCRIGVGKSYCDVIAELRKGADELIAEVRRLQAQVARQEDSLNSYYKCLEFLKTRQML